MITLGMNPRDFAFGATTKSHTNGDNCPHLYTHDHSLS